MLASLQELRDSIETDATSGQLMMLANDAEATIIARFGAIGSSQTLRRPGRSRHFYFGSRTAASVSRVDEIDGTHGGWPWGSSTVTLNGADYALRFGGRALERLTTGPNGRCVWGDEVEVTFLPLDDTARRKRVQVDMVRLALTYRGLLKSVDSGSFSSSGSAYPDAYSRERDILLNELVPPMQVVA